MLFNSLQFALFLPVVLILYWLLANKNLKWQNALLLISSYIFYASWDPRFLFLLLFSTSLDFITGVKIYNAQNSFEKKFWFWLSISANLGFLGFFKYYNFFASNITTLLGLGPDIWVLNILLPLGISFYTFHGMSYVIDIYNGRITPTKSFIDYAVFVAFFPLLIAGPIERATHLLPQISKKRIFSQEGFFDGLKQILWGLFKKMVIADNCAPIVSQIFNNSAHLPGSTLALGAVLFTLQVYGDFSGYSDIAIGAARLMGIELFRNFAFPFFSRDIPEFWRRWHISLSSWFRDYLYIPLGGSKHGKWLTLRNIFITFLLCGLWHGANWTFVAYGTLNAIYFIPGILFNRRNNNKEIVALGKLMPSIKDAGNIITTFLLTAFAMIFFRSPNFKSAISYMSNLFSRSLFSLPGLVPAGLTALIMVFIAVEWLGREQQYAIANINGRVPKYMRWAFYYFLIAALFFFAAHKEQKFIYFQF